MMRLTLGAGLAPESRAKWLVCCDSPRPVTGRVVGAANGVAHSSLECDNCGTGWGDIFWPVDIETGKAG